jgi:hypothetical protein
MSKLKYETKKVIDSFDWDDLVRETYKKPYCFQQQDGCQSRGVVNITISKDDIEDYDFENDTLPFKINGNEMGVSFKGWLETSEEDINKDNPELYPNANKLFWSRNFYPALDVVANDLCKKGLIEPGDYVINIDW